MENKQLEIIQTIAMMFRAAPGAHYLSEFIAFIDNAGSSVKDLANLLAQTDVFKRALYADTFSNHEFSMQFVENSVGALVNDQNKAWAVAEIEHALDAGANRGEVIYLAAKALASVDVNHADWGMAAQQFHNKVAVAAFYSMDLGGMATSLDVLQRVTANVTHDIASVAATKALMTSGITGKVIDGYVKEAFIFADLNGDGLCNPGESSAITDALGNFSLTGVTGFGSLMSFGGIDTATGKPFEGSMTAPAGATIVSPLTTLIDRIARDSAASAEAATEKVLSSLGLNTDIDLLHFDPIKEIIRTDTDATATSIAVAIHAATIQIQTLISQTAALLSGAGISADETTAIDLAYETFTASLASHTGLVDLTSKDTIEQVIQGAAALSGADDTILHKVDTLLADASQTVANLNQAIADKSTSSTNSLKILSSIAAVQIVAENVEVAMKSGAATGNVTAAVTSTTGSALVKMITAAGSRVGDVTGDGKPDALPPSSGGSGSSSPSTIQSFLATNATAFSGTAADDILSISTSAAWSPLVMKAVQLNGGAGANTLKVQDGSSIVSAIVMNFPNLFFDATGAAGINSVTMSATQHQNFTGTITAPGSGMNGEEIIIAGDGAMTTLADIEHYSIGDDSSNARTVVITDADTNVTANSPSDTVTFDLGALTYTGIITGAATVDDTLSLSAGADISGGTITNVEALELAAGASVRLSAAQNQNFTGTITAPGSGMNGEEIIIADDGAMTTLANIENYSIGDDSSNARTVAITDADTNVTANSPFDAVTFDLGALTYTGTITGEATVDDTLSLSAGADISGGTITNVEALQLATGASVQLSVAQNQNFTGTITAPGSGMNGEEIIIVGDGAMTTLANIEYYNIDDDSTNARTVAITDADTNVTANSPSDAVTFNLGALTYTGTLAGESTVTDTLILSTGADISGGTISNVEALELAAGASVQLSAAQNQNFTGTIMAPGSGMNGEEIIIAGDGAMTTLANIEKYSIGDDSSNARTVAITDADTNITANSLSDAVTFILGALTYTGTITGEATVDDTLSLSAGADISGGTITNVEALELAAGASVRLSAAQNQNFTGTITASGTGVSGEEITIVGDGAITTLVNIENYSIGDDSSNTRAVAIADADTNVTANSPSDAVTFNIGALIYTGTITGEATVSDTLSLSAGADISDGTINNVQTLELAAGASVRLSAAQNQSFAGTVTAPGAGASGEEIIIVGNGAVTVLPNIENYELGDDTTNARTLTLGSAALTLIADNATDTITVNAAALAENNALTLGTSASALIVSGLMGDIAASNLTGTLTVTTADATDNGINITTGSAATFVDVAAGAASDTVSIDATALNNNTALTVTSGAAAAGIVNITGLAGNLAISNPTSATISVVVADNTVDDGIAIAAGASNLAIGNVADGDTVTVTGFMGSTLTGMIAGTTGKFNISAGTATNNITTAAGNDVFTFAAGTGLTGADVVDGGAGSDTVVLTGDTAVAATHFNNVRNIEAITIANTATNVAITTSDVLVAAGAVLTLQAASLTTGVLTFNGAAEANGSFNVTGGGANDSITGSPGNDTLAGGNGNDSITAGSGNDALSGDAGNDTLRFATVTGLTSADAVDGGAGTDTVALTGNTAFTTATDFDNVRNIEAITLGNTNTVVTITTQDALVAAGATLTLSNAANSGVLTFNGSAETNGHFNITGGSGSDSIISGSGNDTLAGGAGDDMFTFIAGTGLTTDTVNGGVGTDTLVLTGTAAITATQFNNVSNIEIIALSDMVNTAVAITTVNGLVASGATLTLSNAANSGVLTFDGAAETDGKFNITGGSAYDIITGGTGNDILNGAAGNDSLAAGFGTDTLSGGADNDMFTFAAGTGLTSADAVDGGAGSDTVVLTGDTAVAATHFNNVSNIEAITIANTTANVAITTQDVLVAAGAVLTFQAASLTTGVLTFNGAAETNGSFNVTGGGANDSITGSLGNDMLAGGNGNDSITAGLGNDTLSGDAGNDTLRFAAVTGLTSADAVDGGAGTDTVALTGNTVFTAVTDFDNVRNIEAITLGNTNIVVTITTQDALVASGTTLTLSNAANSGALTFNGSAETDGAFTITGGTGNDSITAGSGNDTVSGGTGNDTLAGGAGNDSISSGAGTDRITGGTGADTMTLGSSANDNTRQTVVYSTTSDGAAADANTGADSIIQFDANANANNAATDDLIQITAALRTAIDDDNDGTLDYSASNSVDLGNQVIAGGTNQEATVLLDAEVELVLADFTASGLTNVVAELGEEIDFSGLATNEEHLFAVNFSATQAALMLYTAGSGGDDTIAATDIQVLGIVTHNDGTSGLVAGNVTF